MKSIFKKYAKLLLISGSALIFSGSGFAAKTHLTMGMSLEPPHLDPTAGAAAAIDEVVYANVLLEQKGKDFHLCVQWNLQANLLVCRIHQSLCKPAVIILVAACQVFP